MTNRRDALARTLLVGVLAATGALTPAAALAQNAGAAEQAERSNQELVGDFIHYVRIANYQLAEAMGQELLNRGLTPAEFTQLIESGDVARFEETTQRALRVASLEEIAGQMLNMFEEGRLQRARDPEQIQKNIEMLTGNLRGRLMGRQGLVAAGEYAMPQLLAALLDTKNPTLQAEVTRVMVDLGRQAIAPLAAAAMRLPSSQQEIVVNVLGLIPYRTSLPYLADLAANSESQAVREAASRAIDRLGGASADAPNLYLALGEGYYGENSEVTSFPGEDFQLLWSFDPRSGLQMTAIRTPVFHEAMAMRVAERAMQLQQGSGGGGTDALALWVASNFSRDIDAPENYENPAYPGSRRSAEYFAVAAGPQVAEQVLGRALEDRDTPLARRALAAVEQTAGRSALQNGGGSPMIQALTYPNRRVQYEAALAIAASGPTESFSGSDRVVPTLAAAIRGADQQYAAVVASDTEVYQPLRGRLESAGYTVLPQARAVGELDGVIAEVPAVDVLVTVTPNYEQVTGQVEQIRGNLKLAAAPVLVLTSSQGYFDLRGRLQNDPMLTVRQTGLSEQELSRTVSDLVDAASGGPITRDEAGSFTDRSIDALRDLAVSGNGTLRVSDATVQLTSALAEVDAPTKLRLAEILAHLNDSRAQRAIMDEAMKADGDLRVALLGYTTDSAKRFGAMLEERQVQRLNTLVAQGGDQEATAAAALMGALGRANRDLVPLILEGR